MSKQINKQDRVLGCFRSGLTLKTKKKKNQAFSAKLSFLFVFLSWLCCVGFKVRIDQYSKNPLISFKIFVSVRQNDNYILKDVLSLFE